MSGLSTIAIPTYNRLPQLRTALESALGQDYGSLRVMVLDNGSTDGTADYCDDIARGDRRLSVVRRPKNLGAVVNFREGRERASSEFFMWLADDDRLDSNYMTECVRELRKDPDAVLATSAASYYEDEKLVFREAPLSLTDARPEARVARYFREVANNAAMYGVQRLGSVRAVTFGDAFGADWCFVAEIALRGRVRGSDKTVIHRDIGGASRDLVDLGSQKGVASVFRSRPHVAIAWQVFHRAARGEGGYHVLSRSQRIGLGARSAGTILHRCCMPAWYKRAEQLLYRARGLP